MDNEEIRVRFAPSPTGPLHIGNVRTALFNWLFAQSKSGKFILRVEDTDKWRSKEEYLTDIVDGLSWLGLSWDEGPERNEPYGPYKQSKRLDIYEKYVQELLKGGHAYFCYCTQEELEKERQTQTKKKEAPKYSGKCRNLTPEEISKFQKEGRKPSVRFKVPPKKIKFKDLIRGEIEFDSSLFGDFIIKKSDGNPTFMFSGAIDDFLMKITHVIRGEDHLSNTPRQILLLQILNFSVPEYAHLPLILNPDRTKLSKRKNPTSLTADFKDKGYLAEAMINFIALLGWSSKTDKDIWDLSELVTEFDLADVGKSSSVFDQQKLDYLNGYYIRKLSIGDLAKKAEDLLGNHPYLKDKEKFIAALSLVQERLKNLAEIPQLIDFLYEEPEGFRDILVMKKSTKEKTLLGLSEAQKYLSQENEFTRDSLEELLRAVAQKNNLQAGEVLWPIRVALTGKTASPGAFEVLEALGKEESLKRIDKAIGMIK